MSLTENTFYVAGGTLHLGAPSYVEREADKDLYEALTHGEFCYVLTSRQMGKSSLMVRTAQRLRERGVTVIVLDLTAVGQNLTPEQWYGGLLNRVGSHLDLEDELDVFWWANPLLGPAQRFFTALRKVALPRLPGRLVVFVDELDTVRSLAFSTDEFFAAIRECYTRRAEDSEFDRLTFCLLGVATPSDLIRDTRLTPFNIGQRIELNDFTEAEAGPLVRGLHASALEHRPKNDTVAQALLRRILYWTNGHPYLTQRLCRALAEHVSSPRKASATGSNDPKDSPQGRGGRGPERPDQRDPEQLVDLLCGELFLSNKARERDDNLLFVRERLLRNEVDRATLLNFYEQVLKGRTPVPHDEANPLVSILKLSGIVRVVNGCLQERNRIYEHVFDGAWVQANRPDAELQRQRAAYRQGVLRTASIAGVILLVITLLALYAGQQAKTAREISAQALLDRARAGRFSGRAGQRFEGLAAIAKAAAIRPTVELRNEAIACLALTDLRLAREWEGFPAGASAFAVDDVLERYARDEEEGRISVRQLDGDQELFRLPGIGMPVEQMIFSPGRQYLAVKYHRANFNQLQVVDLNRREDILNLPEGAHESAFDFSPDGRRLAVGQADGSIHIYELSSGQKLKSFSLGTSLNSLRFHPEGHKLAISSRESLLVRIVDLDSGEEVKSFTHRGQVNDVAWHPDGLHLATACTDSDIYVWDTEKGEPYTMLKGSEGEPRKIAFSHRGDLLASSGSDEMLRIWHPFSGRQLTRTPGSSALSRLHFNSDDSQLGCTLSGTRIGLWELAAGRECRTLHGHAGAGPGPNHLAISSNARWLASASGDGVQLWDVALGRKLDFLKLGTTVSVHFEPDNAGLIASDLFGLHRLPIRPDTSSASGSWRVGPAERLLAPPVDNAAMSSDGRLITVVHQDHIDLINNLEPSKKFTNHPGVNITSISPDGAWVVGSSFEQKSIKIWNVQSEQEVQTLPVKAASRLAFSPDGKWLVTGTGEEYRFWKVGSWEAGLRIPRFRAGDQPGVLAFSPDGKILAIAHSLTLVHLIDPKQGQLLASLEAPDPKRISWLSFAPDGSHLAAATENQLIHVWNLPLIRQQLAAIKLDWEPPLTAFPSLGPSPAPFRFVVQLGNLDVSGTEPEEPAASTQTVEQRLAEYTTRIEANPNDAEAHHQRGHVHQRMGQSQKALDDFSESLRLKPGSAPLHLDRARVLETLTRFEEAAAAATQVIEIDPKESLHYDFRAGLHFRRQDYDKAIADVSKAIELSPQTVDYWNRRANYYAESYQWQNARGDFQQTIEMDPKAAPPRLGLVLASLAQGDTEAYRLACEGLNQGFLNSENHAIAVFSAQLCALLPNAVSNFTAVVQAALEAIDKHEGDSDMILSACLILYRAGRFDEAVRRLNEIPPPRSANQRLVTRWDGYRGLILAMSYQRLGQTQEAQQWIEKAESTLGQAVPGRTAGLAALSWQDRVVLQTLRREAEQLFKGGASRTDSEK